MIQVGKNVVVWKADVTWDEEATQGNLGVPMNSQMFHITFSSVCIQKVLCYGAAFPTTSEHFLRTSFSFTDIFL